MAGFIQEATPNKLPLVPRDFRHSLCTGETGSGKTSSFILPNMQQRLQADYGMLIIDFKGNLHSQVKILAEKEDRLEDVMEIGVPWGSKINLFKNISRALFLDTLSAINGDDKDQFWLNSSLRLAGQFYDIFALYENISELSKVESELSFDYKLDALSLNSIVSSKRGFKDFIDACESIVSDLSLNRLVKMHKAGVCEDDVYLIRQFSKEFKETLKMIDNFYDDIDWDSPASGNGGVFFVLRSLMHTFTQTGLDGSVDLKALLEQGKIVVLRSDTYDQSVTLCIMNILYKRLLIRNNSRPISLFVDEFQRTVSEDNIPFVDLFREMRVELIAALQNIQQLENGMGKDKCDEFMGNILYNYAYSDHRENALETFEYTYRGRKFLAEPIFFKTQEKHRVQIKWQNYDDKALAKEWVYYRPEGYKRAVIMNIKTKKMKYHYILDKKDILLTQELRIVSRLEQVS